MRALHAQAPAARADAPHIAGAGEPIPAMSTPLPGDGPDMRDVTPIEDMLVELQSYADDEDDVGYAFRWRELFLETGATLALHIDRKGERHLQVGMPCDEQACHRNRWTTILLDHLKASEGRRDALRLLMDMHGPTMDERPTDAAATTRAVRDFVKIGGRIMVDPTLKVSESDAVPELWLNGSASDRAEVERASRAYFDMRKRLRADRQLLRIVTMLGTPTPHGWIVMEARP